MKTNLTVTLALFLAMSLSAQQTVTASTEKVDPPLAATAKQPIAPSPAAAEPSVFPIDQMFILQHELMKRDEIILTVRACDRAGILPSVCSVNWETGQAHRNTPPPPKPEPQQPAAK